MAHEIHPLMNTVGISIPNTHCDIGSTCDIANSGNWTSSTSYGFGYNALGVDDSNIVNDIGTSNYFSGANQYRPFADYSTNPPQENQIIMSQNYPIQNKRAKITYKVNISANQSSGEYETGIVFIAVPKY
jgi:hypothetical protein